MGNKRKEVMDLADLVRAVPFIARAKPQLLRFLRSRSLIGQESPRLKMVGVFDAGVEGVVMCHFVIEGRQSSPPLVAPLQQFSIRFGRGDPVTGAQCVRRKLRRYAA